VAVALSGVALAAAACGGGNPAASAAASSVPATYQQAVAYSECMRAHGDPGFPDPKQGPGGAWLFPVTPLTSQNFSGPGYSAAQKACHKLQPTGQWTPAQREAALRQLLALSRCMRAHGITNFPDPSTNGGGVGLRISNGLNSSTPQFRAAGQACGLPGP